MSRNQDFLFKNINSSLNSRLLLKINLCFEVEIFCSTSLIMLRNQDFSFEIINSASKSRLFHSKSLILLRNQDFIVQKHKLWFEIQICCSKSTLGISGCHLKRHIKMTKQTTAAVNVTPSWTLTFDSR